MALCSDLLVIAEDARIGYPPARVWGVPTSMMWAHRIGPARAKDLLFTGDLIDGAKAHEWGLALSRPARRGARRTLRGAPAAHRANSRQPAGDDEARGEPGPLRAGPPGHPDARRDLRRHRPPHPGGLRLSRRAPPPRAGRPRCASATSRTATRSLDERTGEVQPRDRGDRAGGDRGRGGAEDRPRWRTTTRRRRGSRQPPGARPHLPGAGEARRRPGRRPRRAPTT